MGTYLAHACTSEKQVWNTGLQISKLFLIIGKNGENTGVNVGISGIVHPH